MRIILATVLFGILLTSSSPISAPAIPIGSQVESYSFDLQRGIDAVRAFEVPGRPCLAREWGSGRFVDPRQRELRSDSGWLGAYLKKTYPERLLSSGLDRRGERFVYVVRLTGRQRIAPQRLRGRAADVPVILEYDAPWSLTEIKRRVSEVADQPHKLVPDLQGASLAADPGFGAVRMEVYSPGGRPRAEVLAQCDALRRLYRLPVLIEFINGKINLTAG